MTIQVELITPEKLAFREEADYLSAPAVDGQVGILAHHAPLLTRLGPGELRLRKGSEVRYYAISGGFMEVQQGSRVSVFAETAELAQEIDVERAKQAVERAKAKITRPADLTQEELAQAEAALSRALVRLKIGAIRTRRLGTPAREPEIH